MQERQRSLSVKPQRLSISLAIAKTSLLKESQPILETPNVRQFKRWLSRSMHNLLPQPFTLKLECRLAYYDASSRSH
jgi:hypothetical protein